MDTATLIAGTASMDRLLAAMAWAERQFPTNDDLMNNARICQVVRAALRSDEDRNAEDAHVIFPSTGAAVPVAPDTDLVDVLRASAPTYGVCDYGDGPSGPIAGLVCAVAPPQIVALALCQDDLVMLATVYPRAHFVFQNPEGTVQ